MPVIVKAVRNKGRRYVVISACLFLISGALFIATANVEPIPGRQLFGLWRGLEFGIAFAIALLAGLLLVRSYSKTQFQSLMLSVISVVLIVCVLEGIGLAGLVNWDDVFRKPVSELSWKLTPLVDVEGETRQDTASAWGIPSSPIAFRFHTDRYGLRNSPDRGDASIYLLGDSIVVGATVPVEKTVAAKLESTTKQSVMQVALSGLSPQGEHDLFSNLELPHENRMVIQFIFEGNDLLDSREYRNPTIGDVRPKRFREQLLLNHLLIQAQFLTQSQAGEARLQTCTIGMQTYTFGWTKNSHAGLESEFQHIFSAIEGFRDDLRTENASFGIVLVPKKLRVLGHLCNFPAESQIAEYNSHLSSFPTRVARFANAHAIPFLDLTSSLTTSAESGGIPWFWGDTHWNEIGHEVAAKAISEWIRAFPE